MTQAAIIAHTDIDRHGEGCRCGLCNANGRSYGFGIFMAEDVRRSGGEISRCEPVDVEYAASEDSARHNAQLTAVKMGYQVISLEDDPADVDESNPISPTL
jgi:hypothetical protein